MKKYPPSVLFLLMTFSLFLDLEISKGFQIHCRLCAVVCLFLQLSWIWVFSWVGFKLITEKYSSLLCISPESLECLRIFNF